MVVCVEVKQFAFAVSACILSADLHQLAYKEFDMHYSTSAMIYFYKIYVKSTHGVLLLHKYSLSVSMQRKTR